MDKSLDGRVAVVTGGGVGIGSAVSLELARQGAEVVVADPGVGVQGEPLDEPTAAATAERINAAGGSASSSKVSVTDPDGLRGLFEDTRSRYGSLDVVVNTAGILRYPKLPDTAEDDWSAVLDVHFNGYRNVLDAALPMMVEEGYGRVLGFTSGVGLARNAGDAMIYGTAKRAVAALTWQLGPFLPAGITVNALSPIAATRMVRDTLRASGANVSGLDLSAMPQPEHMAHAAAYLVGERAGWCRGQVIFSAGSELSVISPPRLLEAARTEGVEDLDQMLATVMPVVLAPAEEERRSGGGSNPRFGDVFSGSAPSAVTREQPRRCLVVADEPALAASIAGALPTWGMKPVGPGGGDPGHRLGNEHARRVRCRLGRTSACRRPGRTIGCRGGGVEYARPGRFRRSAGMASPARRPRDDRRPRRVPGWVAAGGGQVCAGDQPPASDRSRDQGRLGGGTSRCPGSGPTGSQRQREHTADFSRCLLAQRRVDTTFRRTGSKPPRGPTIGSRRCPRPPWRRARRGPGMARGARPPGADHDGVVRRRRRPGLRRRGPATGHRPSERGLTARMGPAARSCWSATRSSPS